jgi:hypothetical protein
MAGRVGASESGVVESIVAGEVGEMYDVESVVVDDIGSMCDIDTGM